MTDAAVQLNEAAPGKFVVSGALTFATARAAREAGIAVFCPSSARDLEVDCAAVSASDSAGMAVLLDWLSIARSGGKSMRLVSLPAAVQELARIGDVLELLEAGV